MATKLDEKFVADMLALYPRASEAYHAITTLANEVKRLEAYNAELEKLLTQEQRDAASSAAWKRGW